MGNWPGYWRPFKQGAIEFVNYDCVKMTVKGRYKIPMIYQYSKENTLDDLDYLGQFRRDEMFQYFQRRSDLLGVFLVNSLYYMLVYKNTVEIRLAGERLESLHYQSPTVDSIPTDWIPVGFERTYCETVEALITPGRIYASPDSKVYYYKGEFIMNKYGELSKTTDLASYKLLLRNKNGNGILFLATGEHIILE